jgi:ribokinase
MAPKTITIIGSLNTDLVTTTPRVPSGGETLTATSFSTGSGGKGANQAVACVRLSRPNPHKQSPSPSPANPPEDPITVKMLGAVGADEFGPPLISGLSNDGIDTTGIKTIPNLTTGVAVILVEESTGENRILLNPGANHTLQPSDFTSIESLGNPLPDLIILQLEIPLETVLRILETAREAGVDVLLNPAPAVELPEDVFRGLAHLIVNESEAAILTGRSVEEVEAPNFDWNTVTTQFLSKGVENIVVTLGAKGAFFASADIEGRKGRFVESEKVERVVDTTAAGDTFVGAYAVGVVRNGGNGVGEEHIKAACRAAGRTVERRGAQSAIPWEDEVVRR